MDPNMKALLAFSVILFLALKTWGFPQQGGNNLEPIEVRAARFVVEAESEYEEAAFQSTELNWAFQTNITDHNEQKMLDFKKIYDAIKVRLGKAAQKFDLDKIRDPELRRKLKTLGQIGTSILEEKDLERYNDIVAKMSKIHSTAKVPSFEDKTVMFSLNPEISNVFAKKRDPEQLAYYWNGFRNASGAKIRDLYKEYIDLSNKAARLNGFRDATEMKIESYDSDTFLDEVALTWDNLKPFFEQLHAYVRNRLSKIYGSDIVDESGLIPGHLLGSTFASTWNQLAKELLPFPDKPTIDVTNAMKAKGWTEETLFEKADDFFQSIGFEPVNENFWKYSLLKKPKDGRQAVCHGSAWDFYNGKDFRIKQCAEVKERHFVTANHEMGHIQYFMNYKDQSVIFKDGANPGFHEGVADILSLAVGTASYYQQLGLLDDDIDIADEETNINILMKMALFRLAHMPFGYIVDRYRWDLYSGKVNLDEMNCHWVKLRAEHQGVSPPNLRTENDFDAGSIFHVASNYGYIRYFVAYVYEFQFYRALCLESGQYDPENPAKPLHRCNFYGSKKAGDKLKEMLKLGKSKPWKDAMEVLTSQREMSTDAFREYFKPLEDWLIKENRKNNVTVGWKIPPLESMCTGN